MQRVLMLSIAAAVMTWATSAVADSPQQHHCFVKGIARTDYFIDITSTLPYPSGVPARLQVHQVSPTYGPENPGRADLPGKKCEVPAVVSSMDRVMTVWPHSICNSKTTA